ncbi:MAG: hypothetical protein MZV65_00800 [Chromatiales bacterium]|nr:hypothetical protein [Chromatiales bacterium]
MKPRSPSTRRSPRPGDRLAASPLSTTRTAYGFSERIRKHGNKAAVTRIAVLNGKWVGSEPG